MANEEARAALPVNVVPPARRCHTLFIRKTAEATGVSLKTRGEFISITELLYWHFPLHQTLLIRKYLPSASLRAQASQAVRSGYRTLPCPHPCPRRCSQPRGRAQLRAGRPRAIFDLLQRAPPTPPVAPRSGGVREPRASPGRAGPASGPPLTAEGSGVGKESLRS